MARTKLAIIGAGSYVFGPSVLNDALFDHKLNDIELALMDVDGQVVELLAGVGRRMAREAGVDAALSAHTKLDSALDGADFVICCAARQLQTRFATDCRIIERYAPGHCATEFGGVSGISYSLRQIALIEEICSAMKRRCPDAWLLNSANPLPRVCQAAHELGIRTVGFCSVSISLYGTLWRVLTGDETRYPFAEGRESWRAVMAGLNHFSWLLALVDLNTGNDLLTDLRTDLLAKGTGAPRVDKEFRSTGYLLAVPDNHCCDFLAPDENSRPRAEASHGSEDQRAARLALLGEIARGETGFSEFLANPSWERPIDLVAALAFDKRMEFSSLNLINDGQIPNLPANVFVETPAVASRDGIVPEKLSLPQPILEHCTRTAKVTDAIVRAALQRRCSLVHEAAQLDPTIVDKAAGIRALDECLRAHADVLPRYE
ncbi:MAG TPA: hypothetical protein VGP72_16145 [Planctomycetota bacterium]|jgi:alpha-galactosidase